MPWEEFTIDNNKMSIGKGSRKDKAYIILYRSAALNFRITARYHDGHFKYYLDCDQAGLYERWISVASVDSIKSIKNKAIYILEANLGRKNINAFQDLRNAENEINKKRA